MMFNFGGNSKASSKLNIPANKKLAVVTGTTSGMGKETVRALLNKGDYFVICANRDVAKMEKVAEAEKFDKSSYAVLDLDLGSFDSTRNFVKKLNAMKSRPVDKLVCNAAVYQPALDVPKYTVDNIEEQLQINHLSHFLLCSLMVSDIKKSKNDPRIIIVGSITGNTNTIGGGAVLPFADLGDLKGLEAGGRKPIAMIDGKTFNGAKAYKDSKICNMMTIFELDKRYKSSGITFSSMYPGCIATTQLFREKRGWFRFLFPLFMKYVTGGFVGEQESGERLAQVVDSPECSKSGVYWSWNGGARQVPVKDFKKGIVRGTGGAGGEIFENEPSQAVANIEKAKKMWDYSTKATGAVWPTLK